MSEHGCDAGAGARRVLFVGPGVADGRRRPWAHVIRSVPNDWTVHLADSDAVRDADTALASLRWQLRVNAPHLVVRVLEGQHPNESSGFDAAITALTEAAQAVTVAVTHPWTVTGSRARHDVHVAIGGVGGVGPAGVRAVIADATLPSGLAVNAALLGLGAEHPAPTTDVLFYGPRQPTAVAIARSLIGRGARVGYLHPSWDEEPDCRGSAYGRWPFAYRAALLGRAGLVVATGTARLGQRLLEARACNPRVVALATGDDRGTDRTDRTDQTDRYGDVVADPETVLHRFEQALIDRDRGGEPHARPTVDAAAVPTWQELWSRIIEQIQPRCAALELPQRAWEHAPAHDRTPRRAGRTAFFVPVYNGERYVRSATESALAQTDDDIEVLILDDGSTDGTWPLVCRLAEEDDRVKAFRQENIGQHGRFDLLHQQILAHTDADALAFLGADDLAAPERIARQRAVLDADEHVDVVYTAGMTIDADGRQLEPTWDEPTPLDRWSMARTLLAHNPIGHPTVLQRRSTIDRFGPYHRAFASDYDYWSKTAGFARYRHLPDRLVAYRLHDASASTGPGADRGRQELAWARAAQRADVTVADLYPELARIGATATNVAGALTHLALNLLAHDPRHAAPLILDACAKAEEHQPTVLGRYCRGVVAAFEGRLPEAESILQPLAQLGFEPASSACAAIHAIRQGGAGSIVAPPATVALPDLRDARPDDVDDVWRSDGTHRRVQVLWCTVDWSDPSSAAPLVELFCRRFGRAQDVQLTFALDGIEEPQAMALIGEITAGIGSIVDSAADLTLLPHEQRPSDAVDLPARTPDEAATSCSRLQALHTSWLFDPAARPAA